MVINISVVEFAVATEELLIIFQINERIKNIRANIIVLQDSANQAIPVELRGISAAAAAPTTIEGVLEVALYLNFP